MQEEGQLFRPIKGALLGGLDVEAAQSSLSPLRAGTAASVAEPHSVL